MAATPSGAPSREIPLEEESLTLADMNDPEQQAWVMQQHLPSTRQGQNLQCLLNLQSQITSAKCAIMCGSQILCSNANTEVHFTIDPSPIAPIFRLELILYPIVKSTLRASAHETFENKRMIVEFAAYLEPPGHNFTNRTPHHFRSTGLQDIPPGPFDFSDHLYAVKYQDGAKGLPDAMLDMAKPGKEMCFSWQSKGSVCYDFHIEAPPNALQDASTFKKIITAATDRTREDALTVVFYPGSNSPHIRNHYWPFFASMPGVLPQSFWPWMNVRPRDLQDIEDIMIFPPHRTFELQPEYIKRALGLRTGKDWHTDPAQKATKVPEPLEIVKLPERLMFRDGRQYLAYILGGYGYEEMHGVQTQEDWFNGRHSCYVFSYRDQTQSTLPYLLLLNIRPPPTSKSDEELVSPQPGDRVSVSLRYKDIDQVWRGEVVRIPKEHEHRGCNVAAKVHSDPNVPTSGRIVENALLLPAADFTFGHVTPTAARLKANLKRLMTDSLKSSTSNISVSFLKPLIMAQDATHPAARRSNNNADYQKTTPQQKYRGDNFMKQIDKRCNERNLNDAQRSAVKSYFQNKFTVVRGPPGSGKSTLIDTIVQLEEDFQTTFWVCTESNTAVEVLVTKTCGRHNTIQPPSMVRVRTMFEEKLTFQLHSQGQVRMAPLTPDTAPTIGPESALHAIERYLQDVEIREKAMSLEELIKRRYALMHQLIQHPERQLWVHEAEQYEALRKNAQNFLSLRFVPLDDEGKLDYVAFDMNKLKLDKAHQKTLQAVQKKLVGASRGVFMTTAAAGGNLTTESRPVGVIIDEASQLLEANAVSTLIEAQQRGKLCRIIMIGDDQQLPPTVMAKNNVFAETNKISFFERLIRKNWPLVSLAIQYRMHKSISSISASQIYARIGLALENGANTDHQGGRVLRFRNWAKSFAQLVNGQTIKDTNAIVISPTDGTTSWKTLKLGGSHSKFNLGNAKIILHVLGQLRSTYSSADIMIICFYKDQVQLLTALLQDTRWDDVPVVTVDKSQGQERQIVIIDTTVQGQVNQDGMGFLADDRRRFNVAMTRAQAGRITIANSKMIGATKSGKLFQAGPWNEFWIEAKALNSVIDGKNFHRDVSDTELRLRWDSVSASFLAKVKNPGPQLLEPASQKKQKQDKTTLIHFFIQATGASEKDGAAYMNRAGGQMHVAVNLYFTEHPPDDGSQDDVEEVPRMESPPSNDTRAGRRSDSRSRDPAQAHDRPHSRSGSSSRPPSHQDPVRRSSESRPQSTAQDSVRRSYEFHHQPTAQDPVRRSSESRNQSATQDPARRSSESRNQSATQDPARRSSGSRSHETTHDLNRSESESRDQPIFRDSAYGGSAPSSQHVPTPGGPGSRSQSAVPPHAKFGPSGQPAVPPHARSGPSGQPVIPPHARSGPSGQPVIPPHARFGQSGQGTTQQIPIRSQPGSQTHVQHPASSGGEGGTWGGRGSGRGGRTGSGTGGRPGNDRGRGGGPGGDRGRGGSAEAGRGTRGGTSRRAGSGRGTESGRGSGRGGGT